MNEPTTYKILKDIPNIENLSYLELGLGDENNFRQIQCKDKLAVDIIPNNYFIGTTDEFFKQNKKKFDIIFIDADHDIIQVIKDYNNSIDICNKFIFIHDMFPPTIIYTKKEFCSDSYKLLAYFLYETSMKPIILKEELGLTLLYKPFKKVELNDYYLNLSYENFLILMMNQKLNSQQEFITYITENK